jgi:hypothetical protein
VLPVKFFFAITFRRDFEVEPFIRRTLSEEFGSTDFRSEVFEFSHFTNYYADELGRDLKKIFISLEDLHLPDSLPDYKIKSNAMEKALSRNEKRIINLDPGYLTMAKVVLATTKDYSHRLYLAKGIYGDLHLYYAQKSFQKQSWTYPDYQQPQALVFFNQLRTIYNQQLAGVQREENDL